MSEDSDPFCSSGTIIAYRACLPSCDCSKSIRPLWFSGAIGLSSVVDGITWLLSLSRIRQSSSSDDTVKGVWVSSNYCTVREWIEGFQNCFPCQEVTVLLHATRAGITSIIISFSSFACSESPECSPREFIG